MVRPYTSSLGIGLLAASLSSASPPSSARAAHVQAKPAPVEITVYAAASLREALTEVAADYEKENDTKIVFNFGSSGDLSKQIIAANKADLFFSADEKEMDEVAAEKLIDDGTRKSLLSNQLVVIEPLDPKQPGASIFTSPFAAGELAGAVVKRLSLASTETVPAGRYAKAWLEKKGVWSKVAERVLPGVDVRAALAAVESGGAQAGIVYRTDAVISKRVRIAYAVPLSEGPKISYPLAVIKDRPRSADAKKLAAYLGTKSALDVFERHGFAMPSPRAAQPEKKHEPEKQRELERAK
jgi:molybdate transport system substrate-binding protein